MVDGVRGQVFFGVPSFNFEIHLERDGMFRVGCSVVVNVT